MQDPKQLLNVFKRRLTPKFLSQQMFGFFNIVNILGEEKNKCWGILMHLIVLRKRDFSLVLMP